MPGTDIRVKDVSFGYDEFRYRSPIKFGGVALDRATILNVEMTVETESGKIAHGFGSMPLGNIWAWPTRNLTYDQTLANMKGLAERLPALLKSIGRADHPIPLGVEFEHHVVDLARGWGGGHGLTESMPTLAALVVASPFDAALHDAYGKAHGQSVWKLYGREYLRHDLATYLTPEFQGEYLDQYVLTEPKPRMPLYHLVGALDPLTDAEVKDRLTDGLPNTLGEWIQADGLTHLKIKLNGDDLAWDVARVLGVNQVAEAVQAERGVTEWWYSLDFNERCQDVGYLIEFLTKLKGLSPAGFARIQYIEQPTARDLKANRQNVMHEAAKLRPVVIDESLLDLESLQLAREMGYTGVAFKACKGQTQSVILAAAAQKYGLFRCVQDLTCPGASLIHSASIAAHIPGVAAIESNGRQYCPAANVGWNERFPGVFTIRDGTMNTALLNGPGLGT